MSATPITRPATFVHKNHWVYSVRTPNGFRHIRLGSVTRIHSKDDAERELDRVLEA